jgi:hypothetical protein
MSKGGLSGDGFAFGFHPEAAYSDEDGEQCGADGEDVTDADLIGQDAAQDEAEDLGSEDE